VARVIDNDINKAYTKLMEVHNLIGENIKYAMDSTTGFLVSSLEEIGEGGFGIEVEVTGNRFITKSKYGESILNTINRANELAKTHNQS